MTSLGRRERDCKHFDYEDVVAETDASSDDDVEKNVQKLTCYQVKLKICLIGGGVLGMTLPYNWLSWWSFLDWKWSSPWLASWLVCV